MLAQQQPDITKHVEIIELGFTYSYIWKAGSHQNDNYASPKFKQDVISFTEEKNLPWHNINPYP